MVVRPAGMAGRRMLFHEFARNHYRPMRSGRSCRRRSRTWTFRCSLLPRPARKPSRFANASPTSTRAGLVNGKEIESLSGEHKDAARRHLRGCREALERIRGGIAHLETDELVAQAFA